MDQRFQRHIFVKRGQGRETPISAISNDGVLHHISTVGPYNREGFIIFLHALNERLVPPENRGLLMTLYFTIWDSEFHHSRPVNE